MYDLLITGGTVVDGTGAPAFTGDVGITDGLVAEVGPAGLLDGSPRRTIDATGLLVTPGFVDVHTHYDGQITWDPLLTPSCWQGVTTVVMGNCGVGFAPAAPDRHDWLIGLMEGVENIPGAALSAGIQWAWESFPEYLDFLDTVPKALDVGTQVPHGAVRAYVMGERGAKNEPATAEDIEQMAGVVREAMLAGALGFSTSRTIMHMAIDGEPVPGTFAAEEELFGIGRVLGDLGTGVFEAAPAGALGEDLDAPEREVAWMSRLAAEIGRPVSYALNQNNNAPDDWRRLLDLGRAAAASGAALRPQVHARTVSLLIGLQTFHAFMFTPSWAEIAELPIAEQAIAMRDPDRKARLLTEVQPLADDPIVGGFMHPDRMFELGDPPVYEPGAEMGIPAIAAREGVSTWEKLYDLLGGGDGTTLLNSPVLNYSYGNLDPTYTMLTDPTSAFGLADGGAHVAQTCDASSTTFLLTHWARDRRGSRLSVEDAVHKMTGSTASLYGLGDRGVLAPGKKGDVNIIDFDALTIRRPELVGDLPGGAQRFVQHADGYLSTINAGVEIMHDGEDTGERPGRILRGAR